MNIEEDSGPGFSCNRKIARLEGGPYFLAHDNHSCKLFCARKCVARGGG